MHFHNDDYSQFSIYDNNFPLIYINNSMSISRQISTIFHELMSSYFFILEEFFLEIKSILHILLKKNIYYTKNLCNQFANEFFTSI